jgi:hypothetical protein
MVAPATAQTVPTYGVSSVGRVNCGRLEHGSDFDALFQCNTSAANGGTIQKAPLFVGMVTSPPYTDTLCDSTKAGMLQWTGTYFQGCNGSAWGTFGQTGGTSPLAFSFTNQTNVATSTTISSNAVTLSGFSGTVTATCGTNCTAIARNGVWGSTTVAGFQNGDTIAIRQTSSATASTTTNATVTVGTTVSGTWAVTTTSDTPAAFSFTDQTGVYAGTRILSDTATLSGFTGTLTATCNTNCLEIARNGVWSGATTLTGFVTGNTIRIKQLSSSSSNTASTATVTVGSTTSSTWTVTTRDDPCPGAATPGYVCPDGTIYAGISPDGSEKMYTTRCDAGMTWDGSACTGTRTLFSWNNNTSNWVATGYTSWTTGRGNTAGLVALVDIGAPYNAAVYCDGLTTNGHSDWYLPAESELALYYANVTAIANFLTDGTYYWSSTEANNYNAYNQRFSDGNQGNGNKNNDYPIRCARR